MAEMENITIDEATLSDLFGGYLKDKQVWVDLVAAMDAVNQANVESPIMQLAEIRYLEPGVEEPVLRETARMLGFDVSQDVLSLNAENLTKIVTQLPQYPDQNSTEAFIKFVDLIMNSVSDVIYLWTKDYVNFYPQPDGPTIMDQPPGKWFKTTHIVLNIELLQRESLLIGEGQSLYGRVLDIFYNFAPIALVIKDLYFVIGFYDKDWKGGSAFGLGCAMPSPNAHIVID